MPHKEVKNKHGKDIPSVTQILSVLNKQFLYRWYGTLGWEECERIKRESAEYGTSIHETISRFLKGETVNDPFIHQFAKEYKAKPVEVEPEEPYISKKHGYQGTFDWVEKDPDGTLVIADLKITGQIQKEYGLQLAAYAQLWNEHHDEKINRGKIYRLDKKQGGKLQVKDFINLKPYWKVFKLLIPIYKWTKEGINE